MQASRSYLLEVQRIDQDLASAAAALFPSGVTRVDSSGQPRAVVRLPRGVKSFKAALAGTGLVELGASRRAASVNAYLHRRRTALSSETFARLSHWVATAVRSRSAVLDPPDPAIPTGAVLDRLKGGAQLVVQLLCQMVDVACGNYWEHCCLCSRCLVYQRLRTGIQICGTTRRMESCRVTR